MLSSIFVRFVNHLLSQEAWARRKLAAHAGKLARFDIGIAVIDVRVGADGLVQALERGQPHRGVEQVEQQEQPAPQAPIMPAVTIRVRGADLPLILQDKDNAMTRAAVEGDAEFASTIAQLAQGLRWDAEHDLSQFVGDIAAARLVGGARGILGFARNTGRQAGQSLAEYLVEEQPVLASPLAVADFGAQVNALRDDVERLSKRIARLGDRRLGREDA